MFLTLGAVNEPMRPLWLAIGGSAAAILLVVPATARALSLRRRRRAQRSPLARLAPWSVDGHGPQEGEWRATLLTAPLPLVRPISLLLACCAMVWMGLSLTAPGSFRWYFAMAFLCSATSGILQNRGGVRARMQRTTDPFWTAGRVSVTYLFMKDWGRPALFDRLTFTLRCLTETPRWGGLLRPQVRCLLSGQVVHGEDLRPSPLAGRVEFAIPADAPGTDVLADPAVFWDLLVEGEGAGFRYRQEFLVPVYATDRPGGALTP